MSDTETTPAPPDVAQQEPTPEPEAPVVQAATVDPAPPAPKKDADANRVYIKLACVMLNTFLLSLVANVASGSGPVVDAIKPWIVVLTPIALTAANVYAFLDKGFANLSDRAAQKDAAS